MIQAFIIQKTLIGESDISRLSIHEQDRAILSPPGTRILHLFRHSPENRNQRHAAVSRGLGIARTVTNTVLPYIIEIEEAVQETCQMHTYILQKMAALKLILEGQEDLVRATEEAMTAEETDLALMEIDDIPDQEDTDHAI